MREVPEICQCLQKPARIIDPHFILVAFCAIGGCIVGPLPPDKGGMKFVVKVVNYFTKWVEAEVLVHITTSNIKDCQPFGEWCSKWKVLNYFSTPEHP